MSTGRDDDALSWGDDDPTLDAGKPAGPARGSRPKATPAPRPTTRKETARPVDVAPTGDPEAPVLGNVGLVALGMIAMAYILFAVGWFIVTLRLQSEAGLPVGAASVVAIGVVAALAPLIWFGASYVLTRHARTWVRFAWLIGGLVLLVPWPFLGTGTLA